MTAHEFLKKLKISGESLKYEVNAANKKHELWQRDSLSIEIYSRSVATQKLQYIHFNPVRAKWKLSNDDLDYPYSSARFFFIGWCPHQPKCLNIKMLQHNQSQ